MANDNDVTDFIKVREKEEDRRISEGVQLQLAAETLFNVLRQTDLPPKLALGALAAVTGEIIFRITPEPARRIVNRMAFEKALRNTVEALELVDKEGAPGAVRGLNRLANEAENAIVSAQLDADDQREALEEGFGSMPPIQRVLSKEEIDAASIQLQDMYRKSTEKSNVVSIDPKRKR